MGWLKTQGQRGGDRSGEKRLDRKDAAMLKRASNAMLKILAFHLKAVRRHLSGGETPSEREDNNLVQERPSLNHWRAKTVFNNCVNRPFKEFLSTYYVPGTEACLENPKAGK